MDDQIDCALDLLRRLPPNNIQNHLKDILSLTPHLSDDLLSSVDQPLMVMHCQNTDRSFLICDYNKDGDNNAYRSPWSNIYYPFTTSPSSIHPQDSAAFPSQKLRLLEIAANDAFDIYRDLYYGSSYSEHDASSLSSVYMWDLTESSFATVVLFKKSSKKENIISHWDAIHVIEVLEKPQLKSAHYRITSTVLLGIEQDEICISGSLTRQSEQESQIESFGHHTINLGKLVEEMETKLRNSLQEVYFGKTKDIMNDLRSTSSLIELKKRLNVQAQVIGKMYAH